MHIDRKLRKLGIEADIALKLIKYRFTRRPVPLISHLLVTNRCNLKCFYCYPQVLTRKIPDSALEGWLRNIDTLYALGCRVFILLGGEPLLRDDIGQIIKHCKTKRVIVELITNGYFVEKRIEDLKLVDSLCFSLDGNEEQNDKTRGKGSFQKVFQAIQIAKAEQITCRLHAVITRETVCSIRELCELAKEWRVTINFTQATIHTDDPKAKLSEGEMQDFLANLALLKKQGYPIANTYSAIRYIQQYPLPRYGIYSDHDIPTGKKGAITRCLRPLMTVYIDANGMMYPCANVWQKCDNSVTQTSIEEAWRKQCGMDCYSCDILGEAEMNNMLNFKVTSVLETAKYNLLKQP